MTRTKVVIVVVLVVVLGGVAGWFLSVLFNPVAVSPVQEGAASSSVAPRVSTGFCCITPGEACKQVLTPQSCFDQDGKGFNSRQNTCDHFCRTIGSLSL